MISVKPIRIPKTKLAKGDKVVVGKASNASLNLYLKAKKSGYTFIKCPCNAKTGQIFKVLASFANGYLLQSMDDMSVKIVAHAMDLKKIKD